MKKKFEIKKNINPVFLAGLLFVWLLIKLGEFGIGFGQFVWQFIVFVVLSPFRTIFFLSHQLFSLLRLFLPFLSKANLNINLKKRTRGRPSKQPILVRLFRPLQIFFIRIFPSPVRITILIVVLFGIFLTYSTGLVFVAHQLPSPQNLTSSNSPLTTQIFDRNGVLLYRIYDGKNRSLVKIDAIPSDLVNATIAIEDKNFWAHPGVDLYGITRAGLNFFKGGDLQGGSTITQQLIKNTLLTPERTWQRKLKEVVLAFWAERIFSKKDILQMYFNFLCQVRSGVSKVFLINC
jgi:hypothetical protein